MKDESIHTPDFVRQCVNLADPRLGAKALSATDEFFAPKERMLSRDAAVFIAGKYDDNGKWMDGWETRRRRGPGHDSCVIRLGLPGAIRGFDIDTSHFTGNYPPAVSIEACLSERDPGADAEWVELIAPMKLSGNTHHFPAVVDPRVWSHLRLHIYPDGGIARLRVYGEVARDWSKRGGDTLYDLAAVENGGRPVAWNDAHFGNPVNLLAPGRGENMGDGWETRRRREPGNDWCVLALGTAGTVRKIEVDTAHFKGNYPDRCSLQATNAKNVPDQALVTQSMFWPVLLPEQPLSMDAVHVFEKQLADVGPITHVRFNIIPDGGISRLRLWGQVAGIRK
ncbi:MAG TPA: allantoicase [Burkholderiales bacterium]|nr:allantoicase [Burkholderiales bacterium]